MSNMASDLHLPDLAIRAFRGIDSLQIPRLGRVTLVVGENGVGKTTLIEAIRVYASRGSTDTLVAILAEREEFHSVYLDHSTSATNWSPLFYGRDPEQAGELSIGPIAADQRLYIEADTLWLGDNRRTDRANPSWQSPRLATISLRVGFGHSNLTVSNNPPLDSPLLRRLPTKAKHQLSQSVISDAQSTAVECLNLDPTVVDSNMIASLWPSVALTDGEDCAVDALRLVYGSKIERIAVISIDDRDGSKVRNHVVVKIKGVATPVSIQSLGGGAHRMFGVGLCLAASRNGFLTIDEAGSGIHHTLQYPFWKMILETAEQNKVQVIATTHAWDSVCGFAEANSSSSNGQGVLLRLERHKGNLRSVEYSAKHLSVAAREGIEVR